MIISLSKREKEFIGNIYRLCASNEDTVCEHRFYFIKGNCLINSGTIASYIYEDLLERLIEYLKKYKDMMLTFDVEKVGGGDTLTIITLKD